MTMDDQRRLHEALRNEAKDWVVHIATGEATEADLAALERWRSQSPLHAEAYTQASRLWGMLGAPLAAAARSEAMRSAPWLPRLARPVGRRAVLGGAVAASAVAVAGAMATRPPLDLWPSLDEFAADYRTATGERRKITLADHASIDMNTRTSLNLRATQSSADSIELIAGEAAVATGPRSIMVHAAKGRISATNAQFTVRCDTREVRVTCLAGLAEVEYEGQRVTVRPREQVVYTARDLSQAVAVDPEIVTGWRDGILIFQNERLAHVIEEVNRYRSGRIVLMNADLGERRISARFKLARLDAVLTQFQEAFGAKVTPLAGGFVLLS